VFRYALWCSLLGQSEPHLSVNLMYSLIKSFVRTFVNTSLFHTKISIIASFLYLYHRVNYVLWANLLTGGVINVSWYFLSVMIKAAKTNVLTQLGAERACLFHGDSSFAEISLMEAEISPPTPEVPNRKKSSRILTLNHRVGGSKPSQPTENSA